MDSILANRRRGGRRQRGQNAREVPGTAMSGTAIPPLSLSGPSVSSGDVQPVANPGIGDRSDVQSINPTLQSITALLSFSGGLQDQESLSDTGLAAQDLQGSAKIGRPMLRTYTSEEDM
ncbi:hypothetical protein AnigIFM60653_002620 [Aspergillus niger]|nr:hypothetical protein AnigIFM60653_002620 [Aspergillus niger]